MRNHSADGRTVGAHSEHHLRANLLSPAIMVPPLLWLVTTRSNGITGRRFIADEWKEETAKKASPDAGW